MFLRMFGKNEFDVPALYQDKAPIANSSCQHTYQFPYRVVDSVMTKITAENKQLYLIHFADVTPRMKQEITDVEISFVAANDFGSNAELERLKKCVLVVPGGEDLVVVDSDGKIRGYYTSTNREEIDRLLLELEILLKKY